MARATTTAQGRAEAELAKARKIMTDEREARHFFYVTMRLKMKALAASYSYVDLSADEASTITYEECMADDWKKMRGFRGDSTLTGWVARIASQAVYDKLVEERFIEPVSHTRASDYRLKLLSVGDEHLRLDIVNLVAVPEMNLALKLHYVEKVDDAEFNSRFASEAEARRCLRTGETMLIEQLLNTVNPYAELVLSLRKAPSPEVSFMQWHDRSDEDDCLGENRMALREVLARLGRSNDYEANMHSVINGFVEKTFVKTGLWTEDEADVWRRRFFYDMPSAELAEIYNVQPPYIDMMYHRLNRVFVIAIRQWWKKNK